MGTPVATIKGMTTELGEKLKTLGITNTDHLLEVACTEKGRKELATKLGVQTSLVLEFANRADLARIKGIGDVYANLLEEAGVDTVKELATRVPANLHAKLVQIHEAKGLASRVPTEEMVATWVAEAKALPKLLEY